MRINCIQVSDLSDQHLRAEWVEILMLPAYIKRSLNSKQGLILLDSSTYTLNTGHARFFYDKLEYVRLRYKDIELEMLDRGYRANPSLDLSSFDKRLFGNWEPNSEDAYKNLDRIITRISMKPSWYSLRGQRLTLAEWISFYESRYVGYKYQLKDSDIKY